MPTATSSHLCLQGGRFDRLEQHRASQADVPAGQVQLSGPGMKNSSGQALTLVDGRIGAGVTSVTIDRSDGSSVQATVSGGWYLAWWPGTAQATTANVTRPPRTVTEHFPSRCHRDRRPAACPAGAHCASGYSFGSDPAGSTHRWTNDRYSGLGLAKGAASAESPIGRPADHDSAPGWYTRKPL